MQRFTARKQDPAEDEISELPLEEQLRVTAIRNPCLTTDEIVVLNSAGQRAGGARAKRTTVPG